MSKAKEERSVDPRFGQAIRLRREQMDLSLNQLAMITGVSPSYINRLEKGERSAPSYPIMESIGTALHFDIAELLQLATASDKDDVEEIRDLIVKSDFRLDDYFASTSLKEQIVKLFGKIISAKWEDKKFIEGAEMLTIIGKMEALLGKA